MSLTRRESHGGSDSLQNAVEAVMIGIGWVADHSVIHVQVDELDGVVFVEALLELGHGFFYQVEIVVDVGGLEVATVPSVGHLHQEPVGGHLVALFQFDHVAWIQIRRHSFAEFTVFENFDLESLLPSCCSAPNQDCSL